MKRKAAPQVVSLAFQIATFFAELSKFPREKLHRRGHFKRLREGHVTDGEFDDDGAFFRLTPNISLGVLYGQDKGSFFTTIITRKGRAAVGIQKELLLEVRGKNAFLLLLPHALHEACHVIFRDRGGQRDRWTARAHEQRAEGAADAGRDAILLSNPYFPVEKWGPSPKVPRSVHYCRSYQMVRKKLEKMFPWNKSRAPVHERNCRGALKSFLDRRSQTWRKFHPLAVYDTPQVVELLQKIHAADVSSP